MKLKEIAKIIYFRDRDSSIGFYDSGNNCHFTDGPSSIFKDGYKEWWINGKFIRNNSWR